MFSLPNQTDSSRLSSSIKKTPVTKKSPALQRQTLEKFCLGLKNNGMEVLKLNRDNKWQPRFLTVSKEGLWLSNGTFNSGDRGYCPLGILWVKKSSSRTKEYSITSIDKHKRGGEFFSHLKSAMEEKSSTFRVSSLNKKNQSQFSNTVQVKLIFEQNGVKRFVFFRCSSADDTRSLISGCNAIIYILKNNEENSNNEEVHPKEESQCLEDDLAEVSRNLPNTIFDSSSEASDSEIGLWEV